MKASIKCMLFALLLGISSSNKGMEIETKKRPLEEQTILGEIALPYVPLKAYKNLKKHEKNNLIEQKNDEIMARIYIKLNDNNSIKDIPEWCPISNLKLNPVFFTIKNTQVTKVKLTPNQSLLPIYHNGQQKSFDEVLIDLRYEYDSKRQP